MAEQPGYFQVSSEGRSRPCDLICLGEGADPGQVLDFIDCKFYLRIIWFCKETYTSSTYHQISQHKFPNIFPGKTGGSQNSLDLLEDVDRVGVPVVYWVTSIWLAGGRSQLRKRNQGRF